MHFQWKEIEWSEGRINSQRWIKSSNFFNVLNNFRRNHITLNEYLVSYTRQVLVNVWNRRCILEQCINFFRSMMSSNSLAVSPFGVSILKLPVLLLSCSRKWVSFFYSFRSILFNTKIIFMCIFRKPINSLYLGFIGSCFSHTFKYRFFTLVSILFYSIEME